jgi:hypothetical protein
MPFWKRESIHERLAREGGMSGPPPLDPRPPSLETGIHGLHRPREWDAVLTAEAGDVEGDSAQFVGLEDGSLLVEEGGGNLSPLAEAVEREVAAPYRATAIRRGGDRWAVAVKRIRVIELPGQSGEGIELALAGDDRTLLVDGEREFGSIRALEELAGGNAAIRATRLDGDLWEIRIDPL